MTIELAPTPTSSNARSAVGQTARGTDYKQSINPDEIPARNATYAPLRPLSSWPASQATVLGLRSTVRVKSKAIAMRSKIGSGGVVPPASKRAIAG